MGELPNRNGSHDVVIIGGGPAGTAAATFLQRRGHRCVLLDRSTFPRYMIGESLIPHSYGTLSRLGLLPKLQGSHFTPKFSVRFVSPDGAESRPFFFSETIEGEAAQTWQVERSEFDQMCLEHAAAEGVEIRSDSKVDRVIFDGDRAVGVSVRTTGAAAELSARVVVDASGRATVIGSQLGLREPIPSLRKTSVWSYYKGGARGKGQDAGETTIVLLPEKCWAWYIPLPDDIVSVGIVAPPDVLFSDGSSPEDAFLRTIATSEPLSARLAAASSVAPVRGGVGIMAYRNTRTVGEGWVMVGDARAFLDPIYSSGVFLALESAEQAAECIHDALLADDVSAARLGAFENRLNNGVGVISGLIHAFYDPQFSFGEFLDRHPDQRSALIDCLVGDVFKDMGSFLSALETMTA
jgi:flavin-dependent dehydrogenase